MLWLGVIAASVLIAVAWSPLVQPRDAGERQLATLNNQIESSLLLSWNRIRQDPQGLPFLPKASWSLTVTNEQWSQPHKPANVDAAQWLSQAEVAHPAFDILLSEAEQKELEENDLESAIAHCQEALALKTDPVRQARGKLRLLQLHLKASEVTKAGEIWKQTFALFTGVETLDQYSFYLIAYLAIRDQLEEQEKATADHKLALILDQGLLFLPQIQIELVTDSLSVSQNLEGSIVDIQVDAKTQSWIHAIQTQAGPELLAATEKYLQRFVIEKSKSHWRVAAEPLFIEIYSEAKDCLILRKENSSESISMHVVSESVLSDSLAHYWKELGILEAGFHAALFQPRRSSPQRNFENLAQVNIEKSMPHNVAKSAQPYSAQSAQVNEGISLPGTPFRAKAWHPNPEAFIATAARPFQALRWGLTLLGLFCAAAGISIQRTVTRQQRLQQMKTDFVANVSHELRTPISSILLMAENLEGKKVSSAKSTEKYHGLIKREAQRLRRLVDDVLDFSRMEREERPEPHLQATILTDWKMDLELEALQWTQQAGAKLEIQGKLPEITVPLDAEALRRAVLNLLDNALRHSENNQLELGFSISKQVMKISVRDHGVGIPAGSEKKIFQPFLQLSSEMVKGKGAGLGLAIVAQISADHDGFATAENANRGGAMFTIHIPISTHGCTSSDILSKDSSPPSP